MKELKKNQHFLVVEGGVKPHPAAGLYRSRSGANRKRREFEKICPSARFTVELWEIDESFRWKKSE